MSVQKRIATDPYAFIQAIVDTHYNAVLNNARTAGLVAGDVGEEALYNAIVKAYDQGNTNEVDYALNVQFDFEAMAPEYRVAFARLVPQAMQYREDTTANASSGGQMGPFLPDGSFVSDGSGNQGNQGGGWDWNVFSNVATSVGNVFSNIWGATHQPTPSGNGNGNPPPYAQPTFEKDNTTLMIVGAGIMLTLIMMAIILRK